MDINQEPTAEQKAEIRKLHNEEIKKVKITGYIIAGLVCIAATF